MKHFYFHLLQILKAFLISLIIVLGLQFSYFYYMQHFVEKQAHQWLDIVLLDLLSEWNQQQFLAHSSHTLIQNITAEQRDSTQQLFEKLDELLQYGGSTGQIIEYGLFLQTTQIRYQAHAHFKHGIFFAIITLIADGEQWKIDQFYYEYAFYPQQKQQGSLRLI